MVLESVATQDNNKLIRPKHGVELSINSQNIYLFAPRERTLWHPATEAPWGSLKSKGEVFPKACFFVSIHLSLWKVNPFLPQTRTIPLPCFWEFGTFSPNNLDECWRLHVACKYPLKAWKEGSHPSPHHLWSQICSMSPRATANPPLSRVHRDSEIKKKIRESRQTLKWVVTKQLCWLRCSMSRSHHSARAASLCESTLWQAVIDGQ